MKTKDTFCEISLTVPTEHFIEDHVFIHLLSGSMRAWVNDKQYRMEAGNFCLAQRNVLVNYSKQPTEKGEFKAVFLIFSQELLKEFAQEYLYKAELLPGMEPIVTIGKNKFLDGYIKSITNLPMLQELKDKDLVIVKHKELLLLLLMANPDLKNVLFNFSAPVKKDLEAFMNYNYKFNVSIQQFSYLTGRSLSAFKRDFKDIFHNSPSRWLTEKRLHEAYRLINKKGKKPSDIYKKVGFEDLSHFSFAFKKLFGYAPSKLKDK